MNSYDVRIHMYEFIQRSSEPLKHSRKEYSGRNIIVRKRLLPDNVSSSGNVFEQTKLR
jgi:hypothetical protein